MVNYIEDFEKSRLVIYTVIVGNYDTLKTPEFIDENCDYVCFTDNKKLSSEIWQIRLVENDELDNTRFQRMYKVLPHKFLPEYEYSIYIDGNVRIVGSFREFVRQQWKGACLMGLKHPSRNNIYDEATVCINFKKDSSEIIKRQIERYTSEGYKADNGLIVSNIIFRKHNDNELIKVMEDWWKEIKENSRRDQLSFNYVCWKNHFAYDISDLKCYKSDYWLNPGIHTDNVQDVEKELIDHIQLADYLQNLISEKDEYIVSKEKEYEQSAVLKEQEHEEALALKEQEYERTLASKEQEYEEALASKEQEYAKALASKEQEYEEALVSKEQELGKVSDELAQKSQEVSELIARLDHMENTLSWRYTLIFRKIFAKRK